MRNARKPITGAGEGEKQDMRNAHDIKASSSLRKPRATISKAQKAPERIDARQKNHFHDHPDTTADMQGYLQEHAGAILGTCLSACNPDARRK